MIKKFLLLIISLMILTSCSIPEHPIIETESLAIKLMNQVPLEKRENWGVELLTDINNQNGE